MTYGLVHPLSSLHIDVLRAHAGDRRVFIETGTNVGHGVRVALDYGFEQIISIESDLALFNAAQDAFDDYQNVEILFGNSAQILRRVVEDLKSPAVFFLDAHELNVESPLLAEITAIVESQVDGHVVMIDDVRMIGTPEWCGLTLNRIADAFGDGWLMLKFYDTVNAPRDLMVVPL